MPSIRKALAKWPGIRDRVRKNIEDIVTDFDPLSSGRETIKDTLPSTTFEWLTPLSLEFTRSWLGLREWKSEVEDALDSFDRGFNQVGAGDISVTELGKRHQALWEAYSARRYFNLRAGS